jgi:hypothetical protein
MSHLCAILLTHVEAFFRFNILKFLVNEQCIQAYMYVLISISQHYIEHFLETYIKALLSFVCKLRPRRIYKIDPRNEMKSKQSCCSTAQLASYDNKINISDAAWVFGAKFENFESFVSI